MCVSPALLVLQQSPVGGDLFLQPHLGVEQLVVVLFLSSETFTHTVQLGLQLRHRA